MEGQKNRNKENENISKWTLSFLDKLSVLIQRLEAKYDVFKSKGGYLKERQKEIKEYLKENQPLKISDVGKQFENINTIKKDLQYIKKEQIINSIGKGKGTVYIVDNKE